MVPILSKQSLVVKSRILDLSSALCAGQIGIGISDMNKSFLQTQNWLAFQKSVGNNVWRFDDGKVVANIIQHDLPFGMNYLYIPHGPEIHLDQIMGGIKNELTQFVAYIKKLAREQKSIFIKIEPLQDSAIELLYGAGFKKSSKEIQPNRSVIIDLDKFDSSPDSSEYEFLGAMHHKTRYNIKVAERHGLKLVFRNDIDTFWKLLKQTAKKDNFETHPKTYYEKLCSAPGLTVETVFVEHEGTSIAGAIWLAHGDTAYYLHGAMDRDPKYKPMMAPYLMQWELIKTAKKYGMKYYDFWGIDAQKWPGVTRFKLGWGGRQIEYPGAFDVPIRGFWFMVYKILRKI